MNIKKKEGCFGSKGKWAWYVYHREGEPDTCTTGKVSLIRVPRGSWAWYHAAVLLFSHPLWGRVILLEVNWKQSMSYKSTYYVSINFMFLHITFSGIQVRLVRLYRKGVSMEGGTILQLKTCSNRMRDVHKTWMLLEILSKWCCLVTSSQLQ